MIKNDFYDTTYPLTYPTRDLTDDIAIKWQTSTPSDVKLSNAYWLGWMAWENVPDGWKLSEYTITGNDVIINIATQPQNINVGYAARRYTSTQSGNTRFSNVYYDDGEPHAMSTGYPSQYLNKYDIMGCAPARQVRYYIAINFAYGATESLGTFSLYTTNNPMYGEDFAAFLRGDSTIDFTANLPAVGSVSISLDVEHITQDNTWTISGQSNGYYYSGIVYFQAISIATAADVNTNGAWVTGVTATNIVPMIGFDTNGIQYTSCCPSSNPLLILGYMNITVLNNFVFSYTMFNGYIIGGFEITIPKNFALNQPQYAYLIDGNSVYYKTGGVNNSAGVICRRLSIHEMSVIIGTFPRVGKGSDGTVQSNYGYTENVMWATYVTDENEFTGTLITGNLTDDEFKDKLRLWQYDIEKWAENDYTEDDLPPYEPGGDGTEEIGDSVPIQRRILTGVSSFITSYGLTAAQVQEFGRKLWSSWADEHGSLVMAMVENFKFWFASGIASDTGSIDISSVLDFIISLKMFPCDITNLYAFSNTGNDGKIYIGRGTYGLEVSSNALYTAVNQIGYLDAGTVNVPKPFGDFRDYNNMNITVYVPYCGTMELNPADVVGRTLAGTYAVDVITGECTFYLEVYAPMESGSFNRYLVGTIDGQLGVSIPITATNSGQIAARRLTDISNFVNTISGFMTRSVEIGENMAVQFANLEATGMAEKNTSMYEARKGAIATQGNMSFMNNILGLEKDIRGQFLNTMTRASIDAPIISGGSGVASFASPDSVYLQMRYGIYPDIANYNHSVGKVSTTSTTLSNCSGWTVCHNVDVSSLNCTEEEKSAIKQLLETGIFI